MYLYKKIISKLIKEKITISTTESCTGGLLAYCITKNKNSSKVYHGGYITYSNELKIKDLNVKKITIQNYGAVSKETAKEMVEGLFLKTKTNICISTTGIAGPSGGSKKKPIGLIYIGIKIDGKLKVLKKNFKGSRMNIQKDCVNYIFKYLLKLI
ncbi:CinA family protein [Pelagibacterales bacterium SAG-MED31]|nr:CinA family protein [Pelagibacterales bacterium SAG-MED31]